MAREGITNHGGPVGGEPSVEGLRALRVDAWAALYDEQHPRIWRYLFVRTGSRDAADDLAAQVFVEAMSSIHRYRTAGKPILAWLYRIAGHHLSKWFRDNKREARDVPHSANPDVLDQRLWSMTLGEALAKLTRGQREIVLLRYFAGCSTREIAATMGRSETAVYSLERRALERMRDLVDATGDVVGASAGGAKIAPA